MAGQKKARGVRIVISIKGSFCTPVHIAFRPVCSMGGGGGGGINPESLLTLQAPRYALTVISRDSQQTVISTAQVSSPPSDQQSHRGHSAVMRATCMPHPVPYIGPATTLLPPPGGPRESAGSKCGEADVHPHAGVPHPVWYACV